MQTVRNSEQRHGIAHPDAVQYLLALSRNLNARGYQRAARRLLKTRLKQMPAGIWRNVVQFGWSSTARVRRSLRSWPDGSPVALSNTRAAVRSSRCVWSSSLC
jgi:hypothetical protein